MNQPISNQAPKKRVVEDIVTPGMIVRDAGPAIGPKMKRRFQLFSITVGDDTSAALQLEALLNREDIDIVDFHKFTFQNTINIAVTYDEPLVR